MRDPETLRFTETHEWVVSEDPDIQGDILTVGISQFAVDQLTDITLVELPHVGTLTTAGKPIGAIETVKAVADLYAPVDGEVIAVNDALSDSADPLANDPYGEGWLFRIRPTHPDQLDKLLDHKSYQQKIK